MYTIFLENTLLKRAVKKEELIFYKQGYKFGEKLSYTADLILEKINYELEKYQY